MLKVASNTIILANNCDRGKKLMSTWFVKWKWCVIRYLKLTYLEYIFAVKKEFEYIKIIEAEYVHNVVTASQIINYQQVCLFLLRISVYFHREICHLSIPHTPTPTPSLTCVNYIYVLYLFPLSVYDCIICLGCTHGYLSL